LRNLQGVLRQKARRPHRAIKNFAGSK
jgi:hypothetical protein